MELRHSCDLRLDLCPLGCALSALGRKEDALLVLEQGYEHALRQSADLKQLLELEDLVRTAKEERSIECENHAKQSASSMLASESRSHVNGKSSETHENHSKLSDQSELCSESTVTSEVHSKSNGNLDVPNGIGDKAAASKKFDSQMNGNHDIHDKLGYNSESCNDLSDTCSKLPMICSKSSDLTETPPTPPKLSSKSDIRHEISDDSKRNKKFCVARLSKSKSISVDFRLSRGIAEVCYNSFIW